MQHLVPNPKTLIAIAVLLLLASPPIGAGEPDPGPALGTNLTFLLPNSGEYPFVDAFKNSLPWMPIAGPLCGQDFCPLDLDADGWVRELDTSDPNNPQVAQTLHFLDAAGRYPGGAYTVLYQGTGNLVYGGSGTHDTAASVPGRDVVIVDPQSPDPLALTLVATDPNDPIRDIRLIMPGGVCNNDGFRACSNDTDCSAPGTCELFADNVGAQIFHPSFLNNLRGFKVIRFMDWMMTNENDFREYDGERATEVWDLFAQAFGSTDRIVRVMGSQSGNSYLHNALLTWGNAASETDVLATAAYAGWALGGDPQVANWNLDRLFLELETVELPHTLDLMRIDAGTLQGFRPSNPIELVHYEGGQHLAGFDGLENNAAMNRLFDSANRDPRMGTIYHDLFKTWATERLGPLFLHYVNVQAPRNWGRFGALEYQDQPHSQSPKFQALQQIISNLP